MAYRPRRRSTRASYPARGRSRVARRSVSRRSGGGGRSRGAGNPTIRLVIQTSGDQVIGAPATLAPSVEKPKGKARF